MEDRHIIKHQQRIFQFALSKLKSREDAEEVCQETMIAGLLKKDQLKNPEKLLSWLYSICNNLICKAGRKHQDYFCDDMSVFMADDLQAKHYWANYKSLLEHGIKQLTPEYKSVIQLKYLNGFSMQEIAEIENIQISTVKSRLFEARKCIKQHVGNMGSQIDFLSDTSEEYVMEQVSTVRSAAEMFSRLSLNAQQKLCRLAFKQEAFDSEIIKAIKDTGKGELFLEHYKNHVLFEEIIRIMNHCDPFVEKRVIGDFDVSDPNFSMHIKQNMFVFNDLCLLDEKALSLVVDTVGEENIKIAIQTADIMVKEKLLSLLPPEKQQDWRKLDIVNQVTERIITEKQIEIVELVYQLHKDGTLLAHRTGPDEIYMTTR